MTSTPAGSPVITELIVCTTCRPAGNLRDQPAQGQQLWQAVVAAARAVSGQDANAHGDEASAMVLLAEGVLVRSLACLNSCSRACTVALQAPGKHSYCFGDLQPDSTTAAEVLACAVQHARSQDGNLPRNERPERLRGGILLRLPPLLASVGSVASEVPLASLATPSLAPG